MTEKKTPFYDIHCRLGAKMITFAGYLMPVMYDSMIAEHMRVRQAVGIFDLTHMGEFEISGPGARAFVQNLVTNDLDRLVENQVMYTCMCYEDGGIVDDLLVYNFKDRIFMVVNASNIAKDYAHIEKYLTDGVRLRNISDETSLIAIQGPQAAGVMSSLTDFPIAELKYYHAAFGRVAGEKIMFSRTGYTGEDGFELYIPNRLAEKLWEACYEAVVDNGGGPVGLGARDSLRLEMKFALYGNDIWEETNPLEAGLGWVVKLDKQDFIGKQALVRIKEKGLKRKLIGFEMPGKVFPRQHYSIYDGDRKIGEVTSGVFSPSLKTAIGMGYVPVEYAEIGKQIEIDVRGQKHPARVAKTPFYKAATHK